MPEGIMAMMSTLIIRISTCPIAALICLMAVMGLLLWPPTLEAGVLLPAPYFSVPLKSGHEVGLRSRYTAFADAFGDFDGQADGLTKLPMDWLDSISFAGSVAASESGRPETSSFAEFQGLTKVGKLSAMTHAWVEKGLGTGSAVMDMQFMDILQVDTAGLLHLNWVVSGTADQQILLSPSNEAASTLTAELFVWPYGALPTPGFAFEFSTYAKSVITGTGNTHLLPNTYLYPAGSRWWVLGQLTIESRAHANSLLRMLPPYRVETTADFGHTVELFIAPDPATPEASFHSASGYDYRATPAAVPEPSSWSLLFAGLVALRLWRTNG